MAADPSLTPRTFYLNEQHELSRDEKTGGGRVPQYHGIDWASKGKKVADILASVRQHIKSSRDPLRDQHYFVLAKPLGKLQKKSKDRRAVDGLLTESVRYDESDSRIFGRLGIDLLEVTDEGDAIVHLLPESAERLISTASVLAEVGPREQARWATIDIFSLLSLA